jgi:hypothetical protein
MRTRVDEQLRREAAQFRLAFGCGRCAYYDELRGECAEGYPIDEHVRADLVADELLFCKLFELG